MSKPSISIIIPFYNRPEFLLETLRSIYAQSFKDYEVIIVDDRSTNKNVDLVNSYLQKLDDERFNFFLKPPNIAKGANGSRNYGFKLSKGLFIKWFDSDDLMNENFLEKQIKVIENSSFDAVVANCGVYNKDFTEKIRNSWRKLIYSQTPIEDYLKENLAWQTGAGLWKREALKGIEPFIQDLDNGQEYIFHLFALTSPIQIGVIEEELFRVRIHNNSISKKKDLKYRRNRFKARVIALSRIINTRNTGKKELLYSMYRMMRTHGKYDLFVHSKIFYKNFKTKKLQASKAALQKVSF